MAVTLSPLERNMINAQIRLGYDPIPVIERIVAARCARAIGDVADEFETYASVDTADRVTVDPEVIRLRVAAIVRSHAAQYRAELEASR